MAQKKVFFIEGNYGSGLSKQLSIDSALECFSKISGVEVHKSKATHPDELQRRFDEVRLKKNNQFKIIYLSCHGNRGGIKLDSSKNSYTKIEDIADKCEGYLEGKLIHFGSCSTLHISENRIQDFLLKTRALAVSGYSKQISFLEGTFLDILLFERYQHTDSIKTLGRRFKSDYSELIERLGFKVFIG